ncbi:hypothetical protein Dimus_025676 [Dionaea muscipula]
MAAAQPAENGATTNTPMVLSGGAIVKSETGAAAAADASELAAAASAAASTKWPGWPGHCVFRLIVPVLKVGSLIGRKGELIKRMCEETRGKIRVLEGPAGNPDRIVLISAKEEPEATVSPAMDAAIRVFRRVNELPENAADDKAAGASGVAFCSSRLLVPNTQAISLIGKQGSSIKAVQGSTGASVRVLSGDEAPSYVAANERIVELQGEALKVLKALEAVVGHLRKFLVDHSVLPLFEKTFTTTVPLESQVEPLPDKPILHTAAQTGLSADYPLSLKREPFFHEWELPRESQFTTPGLQAYGQLSSPALQRYGPDSSLSTVRSSLGLGRSGAPVITQVAQTMQIPLSYAEDIIGAGGKNIAYIRRTSGAILTVQESRVPDEITVEIKGTSSQVQLAQELIQESISNHKDPLTRSYGKIDMGMTSSYSQLGSAYPSSSLSTQPYGRYGSSGLGGYSSFRL